ncbi:PepSY-associated TM helix domain-containing protein [Marinicella sediminis]|uniref:PepSY-associated TM helix domain-containing protein n=1 Tax=Marinicella sediminis TaxID=1792834 RepID=A0ABV7JFT7_9GAMM|nr:PepSY-associated TM helix domain-containing protein [Marinicella sediminis]
MKLLKQLTPSRNLVKQTLRSHAWIGLVLAAVLYLVCLSGSLLVFKSDFERWEQSSSEPYLSISDQAISRALAAFQTKVNRPVEALYFVYPSKDLPRAHVADALDEWWVDKDGALTAPVDIPWTDMLTDLHYYLHLPGTWGMIIVGMLGAMMCGLMVSGLLSHPNLFKDAFKLRLGSNRQLEQTDVHNRLSVWSLPFFFVISLTGGYIGLFGISMTLVDYFEEDYQAEQIISEVFGHDPSVDQPAVVPQINKIHRDLNNRAPDAQPLYLVVQNPGTDQQYIEVAAYPPDRLIYSEIYRYHSDGSFIDYQHLADGSAGRQVAYSSYRLHFGTFGGPITQWLYLVLGLAMTVITVTGVNMWFEKRNVRNRWYTSWRGFVWLTPLALVASAFGTVLLDWSAVGIFWLVLAGGSLLLWAGMYRIHRFNQQTLYLWMKQAALLLLIVLLFAHGFGHTDQPWYWSFSLALTGLLSLPMINFRRLIPNP